MGWLRDHQSSNIVKQNVLEIKSSPHYCTNVSSDLRSIHWSLNNGTLPLPHKRKALQHSRLSWWFGERKALPYSGLFWCFAVNSFGEKI